MKQNGARAMIPKYPSIALLSLIIAIATSYFVNRGGAKESKPIETKSTKAIEPQPEPDASHWYNEYTADNCERCPECCVIIKGNVDHCEDCPGPECDCVKTVEGEWMLDETIGDE